MRRPLPGSKRYEYQLKLHSPAILGNERARGDLPRVHGSQLRGLFRRRFEVATRTQLDSGISRLWGDAAIRGIVQVSDAFPEREPKYEVRFRTIIDNRKGSPKAGNLVLENVITSGEIFKGELFLSDQLTSEEKFFLRLSMRGFHSIGLRTRGGFGACEIEIINSEETAENLFPEFLRDEQSLLFVPEHHKVFIPRLIKSAEFTTDLINETIRSKNIDIGRFSSRDFEKLIAELLRLNGFDVELTPETRDGGFDILAIRHENFFGKLKFIVECKKYAQDRPVTIEPVRSLLGVAHSYRAHKALLVTTSRFTKDAQTFATENSTHIELRDYIALRDWLGQLAM